jgi:hypothetical protein
MVLALLVAVNASSLCVARTNICAPAGSTLAGTIGQSGGQVTIQINSLCQGLAGIPLPPPEQTRIFVDLEGEAKTAADRKTLGSLAAKRGTACPVTRCCPP